MASYRDAKSKTRGSVSVRGYWADVLVSPYVALGVEAPERRLFARKNRQHVKVREGQGVGGGGAWPADQARQDEGERLRSCVFRGARCAMGSAEH